MLWIREPDTPGGFNDSIACKPASSSATAEDMTEEMRSLQQLSSCSQMWSVAHERSCVYFYTLLFTFSVNGSEATMMVNESESRWSIRDYDVRPGTML
jgi:hypothetical protein